MPGFLVFCTSPWLISSPTSCVLDVSNELTVELSGAAGGSKVNRRHTLKTTSERLRVQVCLAQWGTTRVSACGLPAGILPFQETIIRCLSIAIRGYDDPNFHIPSGALTLHLWSCEIMSASLFGIGSRTARCGQDGCMEQLQNLDLSPMSAVGAALLRFILAGFWIVHWWFKVGHRGMPATEAFFLQHGLPPWLAWFDISFEVVIAVCLIVGIYVPLLCLISLPILFASMWIYRRNGFYFSGGGIELPVLWACAQIAQVLLGPGAFRIPLPAWLQLPPLFGIPL